MISVLENVEIKKKMLEACIVKLQDFTRVVKSKMKQYMQKECRPKELTGDNNSLLSESMRNIEIKTLECDLDNAVKEMRILKYLNKTNEEDHTKVGLGAVVVTHRNTFFVATDLQRCDIDGEKFIAISNQCPLFKSMRGKRKGERFIHKDLSYQILDLY